MLDQQFFGDPNLQPYFNENFVVLHPVRQEQSGQIVFDRFGVGATPTVMVVGSDGIEIDRMVGYQPPPEDYKLLVEDLYRKRPTTLDMMNKLEANPDDTELAVNLAKRMMDKYRRNEAPWVAEFILRNPDKAKQLTVTKEGTKFEANAYEFAKFLKTYESPEHVVEFVDEFSESTLEGEVFNNLRIFLYYDESRDGALKVFKKLIKADPDNVDLVMPYVNYAGNSGAAGDEINEMVLRLYKNPDNRSNSSLVNAYQMLLLKEGDQEKARKVAFAYLESDDAEDYMFSNIGHNFHNNKMWEDAFKSYELGLKTNPDNTYMYYAIGRTAAVSGKNLKNGLKRITYYIEENPNESPDPSFAAAHWRRGLILEHMGEIDRAVKDMEMCLKIDPNYEEAKKALDRMKK